MANIYLDQGYKEGDVFEEDGVQVTLTPDGTTRPTGPAPEPVDQVEVPVEPAPVEPTEPAIDPGAGTYKFGEDIVTIAADGTKTTTQAPAAPTEPVVADQVTDVGAGGVTYNEVGSRVLSDSEQEISDYYSSLKPKTQEEQDAEDEVIRERRLVQQKEAIDSVNTMYNNLLGQIRIDNSSRVGSGASITALSGGRGSASGKADADRITTANQKVIDANEAKRQAQINAIMSDYDKKISDEIANATRLRTEDANAYISYKAGEVDRNKGLALELRRSLISGGISPEEITDDQYNKMAEAGGYSVDQAKSLYKSEFDSRNDEFLGAQAKEAAEIDKLKAETEKIRTDVKSNSKEAQKLKEGYVYINTPQQRDDLIAQGRIMVEEDGRTYMLPDTVDTKVIVRGKNSILINSTTGEDVKDLGPSKSPATAKADSTKNYTATTIPADIKADVLYDKSQGRTIEEMMGVYPEVSTSYLQSLYGINSFQF